MRINGEITAPTVRLISQDGEQVGVIVLSQAIERAREAGMDLVEVSPDSNPPVCKLMDYGKFKYRQKKKVHQGRTKQHAARMKELRLKLKTDQHDIDIKRDHARKFLEKKHKVLVTMFLRGHLEMKHADLGEAILSRFASDLEDIAKVEKIPAMEGRRMQMILTPK
ncbi:MAG: translation initiation factor IF-3 [Planctomycetota bacterium]